jgi:hypothetical protein
MKISTRMLIAGSVAVLAASELVPLFSTGTGLIGDAQAIVGAPMTPVSVAGVARRSAYRSAAAATSASAANASAANAAAASASAAAASASAAQVAAAPPAPAPAAGAPLAVGTVVAKLPSGCVAAPVGGVEYYLCNGTYFRAAFQGNELVYVVQKP